HPEIVIETNEVYKASGDSSQFFPSDQGNPTSVPGVSTGTVLAAAFAAAGGSGRIYAVQHDGMLHAGGPFVAGWPVKLDGLTLNGIVDLVLVGQNMPFNHVLQAWTGATGQPLPGFPKVIDDFGLTTVPLIANVGATSDAGDTLNLPELISGNGLYLVHALDATGQEPSRWPKLTGGWMTGQPAAGDLDHHGP